MVAVELPAPLIKTERLTDPYVVGGDRAYLIGAQDGGFPDVGHHVPHEMWGLWVHPHKLLDGYWCALRAEGQPAPTWLISAGACQVEATSVTHLYECPELGVCLRRRQWAPEGAPALFVEFEIERAQTQAPDATPGSWPAYSAAPQTLELTFLCGVDLRPGWLQQTVDGDDSCAFVAEAGACVAHDAPNGWAVAWGSATAPLGGEVGPAVHGPVDTVGHGCSGALRYTVQVPLTGPTRLVLGVYGAQGPDAALAGLEENLLGDYAALWQAKEEHYRGRLGHSRLDVPDAVLMEAWDWIKCNYAWLVRDVPGVGRGLGAGFAEYPWWFGCDTAYALRGLLPLGDFATAAQSLRLLAAASTTHNGDTGQIVHEVAGSGVVYNPGNTQETPQFTCAVYETYLWSGDEALLRDLYPLCRRGVLEWTLGTQDADGDLLPAGYGITEVAGLNNELIDSAAWTAASLLSLGAMAERVGDSATVARCAAQAPRVRQALLERFWLPEEGIYGDVVATPRQILERLEAMERQPGHRSQPAMETFLRAVAERAATLPPDQERAWYLGNWPVMAPLELGLAPVDQAEQVFARLESAEFSGPHGVYLSSILRTSAMSISTGALAAAESVYGRVDQAIGYARQLASSLRLHMPGAISEMSPDQGCFVQAWSGYGVVYPVARGVFGLAPDAARRHMALRPQLPQGWDHASLAGVRVGTTALDVALERDAAGVLTCTVAIGESGWRIETLPPAGWRLLSLSVDDQAVPAQPGGVALAARCVARLSQA